MVMPGDEIIDRVMAMIGHARVLEPVLGEFSPVLCASMSDIEKKLAAINASLMREGARVYEMRPFAVLDPVSTTSAGEDENNGVSQ